jgi:hypothetical protein
MGWVTAGKMAWARKQTVLTMVELMLERTSSEERKRVEG